MAIQLSPELEKRLLELAQREKRSPESIIIDMFTQYEANTSSQPDTTTENILLLMAQDGKEANIKFTENNVGRRTREILEQEYAEALLRRMRDNNAE